MVIYPAFPGGKRKAFTLSYDDGVRQDIRFIEILNKHGLKGTFNLNSGLFEQRKMDIEEAKKLYKGHEVAVHSLTHPYLERIPPENATYEILKDRENLENIFGGSVRGSAYPFGTYNDKVVEILNNCGICYARTVKQTENFNLPQDWLRLNPTCHHKNPKLFELCDDFLTKTPNFMQSWLFYVWGHTYEFDNNDNWDMIEEFLEKISGHEDVWYATNIEIYDYLKAFKSLITSSDCKYIYNPTATVIYCVSNTTEFKINPGEEIYL